MDQFDWTQHNRFWREDFKLAREQLGIQTLRYALPWHKLELEPGKFVWDLADERINAAKELGIELYLDIMHFGTPLWLKQAAGDPEFPEALERFTQAIVARYSRLETQAQAFVYLEEVRRRYDTFRTTGLPEAQKKYRPKKRRPRLLPKFRTASVGVR